MTLTPSASSPEVRRLTREVESSLGRILFRVITDGGRSWAPEPVQKHLPEIGVEMLHENGTRRVLTLGAASLPRNQAEFDQVAIAVLDDWWMRGRLLKR